MIFWLVVLDRGCFWFFNILNRLCLFFRIIWCSCLMFIGDKCLDSFINSFLCDCLEFMFMDFVRLKNVLSDFIDVYCCLICVWVFIGFKWFVLFIMMLFVFKLILVFVFIYLEGMRIENFLLGFKNFLIKVMIWWVVVVLLFLVYINRLSFLICFVKMECRCFLMICMLLYLMGLCKLFWLFVI